MQFPPQDFEKLRQFLILFRQGEIDLTIGKKSLAALISMVNEPDVVATSNIVELADKTAISPASITRLVRLLGFHGFNQFQNIFKQRNKTANNYYSQKVKILLQTNKTQPREVIKRQLKSAADNIQQCLNRVSDEELNQSKILLARKRRIFIVGNKQSSAIASILRYGLCLIRDNVQMLGQTEHGMAIELGQLKKDDLLVIFSSSPYSNLTLDIASLAKKQACQILAITDSLLSPLNDFATVAIHIPTEGNYYTNSLAANCIFIESLLSLTAIELGSNALVKLQQHEKLLSELRHE